jgi:hypothetical protein
MANHLVAVWAHCYGTPVTASTATASTATASTATTTTAPAASSAFAFGHSHYKSGVLFHDEVKLLVLGIKFCAH